MKDDDCKLIIKYSEMPLLTIDYSFVIKQDQDCYSFIIKCYTGDHFEIKWKQGNFLNLNH